MDETATSLHEKTYQIGGVTYRLEPLSWQQNKWLGEHIFKGVDMVALDYGVIHDLLREKGPLFMAICLLPEGTDRAAHSRQPWRAIEERAQAFAGELTGGEVALFGPHFFTCNRPDQMAMLLEGKVLQRTFEGLAQSLAPGASGLSAASMPSPMATSPSGPPSSPDSDQPTPSPRSGDVSSGAGLISPSLVSAG